MIDIQEGGCLNRKDIKLSHGLAAHLSQKLFGSSFFLDGFSTRDEESKSLMLLFFLKNQGSFSLLSSRLTSSSSWTIVTSFSSWLDFTVFSSSFLECLAICSSKQSLEIFLLLFRRLDCRCYFDWAFSTCTVTILVLAMDYSDRSSVGFGSGSILSGWIWFEEKELVDCFLTFSRECSSRPCSFSLRSYSSSFFLRWRNWQVVCPVTCRYTCRMIRFTMRNPNTASRSPTIHERMMRTSWAELAKSTLKLASATWRVTTRAQAKVATMLRKNCGQFLAPTQLLNHMQWWSKSLTQRLQVRQCLLLAQQQLSQNSQKSTLSYSGAKGIFRSCRDHLQQQTTRSVGSVSVAIAADTTITTPNSRYSPSSTGEFSRDSVDEKQTAIDEAMIRQALSWAAEGRWENPLVA